MLGVTTPGHRAHRAPVVARLEPHVQPALEQRRALLGCVDQALEHGPAHQRASERSGGAFPGDRRTRVQELASLQADGLVGREHVDQDRLDGQHPLECSGVRVDAQRVERHGGQVVLGAGDRRPPVDAAYVGRLVGEGVGEQVDADADDVVAHDVTPRISSARRVAPALDRWTSAPAAASAST